MSGEIHLNISEEDRIKFEQFKRRHSNIPQKPTTSPHHKYILKPKEKPTIEPVRKPVIEPVIVNNYITEEEIFEATLNMLFEGMRVGNQIDKKSAEKLVQSIQYKFPKEFYNKCLSSFEETLKEHEKFLGDSLFSNAIKATQDLANKIGKITQKIMLTPNNETPEPI